MKNFWLLILIFGFNSSIYSQLFKPKQYDSLRNEIEYAAPLFDGFDSYYLKMNDGDVYFPKESEINKIFFDLPFDYVYGFNKGHARLRNEGEWYFIDQNGKKPFSQTFEQIGEFHKGVYPVLKNGKWGLIDNKGEFVLKPIYDKIRDGAEGLFAFYYNKYWGFINLKGKVRIKPIYDTVDKFENNISKVVKDDKWGAINRKGKIVFPLENDELIWVISKDFFTTSDNDLNKILKNSKGEALDTIPMFGFTSDKKEYSYFKENGKYGYLDKKGRVLLKPQYDRVTSFNNGIAGIKSDSIWYFINKKGKRINSINYQEIEHLSDDLFIVAQKGKKGVINSRSKELLKMEFIAVIPRIVGNYLCAMKSHEEGYKLFKMNGQIFSDYQIHIGKHKSILDQDFNSGLIPAYKIIDKKRRLGYMNKFGEIIIPLIYEYGLPFNLGQARIQKNGLYGIIDIKGNEVVPPIYKSIGKIENGYAVISNQKYKKGLIDYDGNLVIPCQYERLKRIKKDRWEFSSKYGKYGIIDSKNKIIIPDEYDEIEDKTYLFKVRKGEYYGIYNNEGKQIVPVEFEDKDLEVFWGKVFITKNGKAGVLDENGGIIFPIEYDYISALVIGLYIIKKNGKMGFALKNGEMILPIEYDEYDVEEWGEIKVRKGEIWEKILLKDYIDEYKQKSN